ncbi:MAG: c-type cytochrome domain-containing protein [Isosphaeraceae bacterium]
MSDLQVQQSDSSRRSRVPIGLLPILAGLLIATAGQGATVLAADPPTPSYERNIKPILARRCVVCHSARNRDDLDLSGGLALDTYDAIMNGTGRRKVVISGRSAGSELVRRLSEPDEDLRMPLQDTPLPQPQRELIGRWIDAGASRGVPSATTASAPTPNGVASIGRPRRGPAMDVILPTDVKLPPGTLKTSKGGPMEIVLPAGPLPAVGSLAFRGDNRLLAVGTYGQVVIWDLVEGRPAGEILGIPGPVHALAFSRDGRRLAIGAGLPARSGVVRIYSVPDGSLLHDFAGHKDVVFALSLRPDGAQLASASFDQTVRLWDLGRAQAAGVFRGHSDFVYAVAYTPDGRHLLTAGKDRTIKRIDVRTLKEERTYSGHDQEVLALAVHPDGSRFVSAGDEPQIRWWTVDGDSPTARRGGHAGPVHQLAFSGDGRRLISAGGDHTVRLWDARTGASLRQLRGPADWQYAVAIADDARLAAAGGWDGLVRLWDAESGRLLATLVQPLSASSADTADSEQRTTDRIEWFAVCPEGYVAGSPGWIGAAKWRAGDVSLGVDPVRAVCVHPDSVARALRGEAIKAVSFPTQRSE